MSTTLQSLEDFIGAAEKSRKYPANTAGAFKSALRLYEPELTDEEKESLDTVKEHLDQISQSVYNKNKSKMSVASLETYKRRLRALLIDYEKYGTDPSKMASWNRVPRVRRSNKSLKSNGQTTTEQENIEVSNERPLEQNSKVIRFEISLRPDAKAIILTPSDMTADEVNKIKGYIEYLATCTTK